MSRTISIALACASVLAIGAPAYAQVTSRVQREVVHTGDLDTYSDRGADVLINRIEAASERVCNDNEVRSIGERVIINACTAETTRNSVYDANNSVVTARYYGYQPEIIVADTTLDKTKQ